MKRYLLLHGREFNCAASSLHEYGEGSYSYMYQRVVPCGVVARPAHVLAVGSSAYCPRGSSGRDFSTFDLRPLSTYAARLHAQDQARTTSPGGSCIFYLSPCIKVVSAPNLKQFTLEKVIKTYLKCFVAQSVKCLENMYLMLERKYLKHFC